MTTPTGTRNRSPRRGLCALILHAAALAAHAGPRAGEDDAYLLPPKTYYRTAEVQGQRIFYREAGEASLPTIVLLHGFPSSSHTYRELIPMLSRHAHVIAPDHLGSGYSARPDPAGFTYTFDALAQHVDGLLEGLGVQRYALYMQDFGAPVGFRLMQRHPERIAAMVVQNGNAYLEGLSPARQAFFLAASRDRSAARVASLHALVSRDGVMLRQYLRDVPPGERDIISPDSWTHDLGLLSTQRDRTIQVQLFQDYQSNIDQYPRWQALMREHRFPALIVWGERDPAFVAAGARAYLRDLPDAELRFIAAGHFAVEERAHEVALHLLRFLDRQGLTGEGRSDRTR